MTIFNQINTNVLLFMFSTNRLNSKFTLNYISDILYKHNKINNIVKYGIPTFLT